MKFFFENICGVKNSEIEAKGTSLVEYIRVLKKEVVNKGYAAPESSMNLASDKRVLESVDEILKTKKSDALRYVFLIGIGGSNLGAKAIYDALRGYKEAFEKNLPKVIFLDTNDPEILASLGEWVKGELKNKEEFLINIVSKSGTTTETAVNTEYLGGILAAKFEGIYDRLIVTTHEDSTLWNLAGEKNIARLPIPKMVGGRYSVFSAVGLLSLRAAGLNVEELLKGAHIMREMCLSEDVLSNPAAISAALLVLHKEKGRPINDNFFFHPELESLGKWYRQLMGESLGKDGGGITPTVSIGSTDLHSMGQLYFGGPKDKFTLFMGSETKVGEAPPKKEELFPGLVKGIKGRGPSEIMQAIFEGVTMSYRKNNLPFMKSLFSEISEHELGEFMQWKMFEIMYTGKLMGLNAFDQPDVELYKNETRKILAH